MFANASPHASAAPVTPPHATPPAQHQPPASTGGPSDRMAAANASLPFASSAPRAAASATTLVTGAYQPYGDAAIDRMIALEAACKRYGSLT